MSLSNDWGVLEGTVAVAVGDGADLDEEGKGIEKFDLTLRRPRERGDRTCCLSEAALER
jgi:hypothetical protein